MKDIYVVGLKPYGEYVMAPDTLHFGFDETALDEQTGLYFYAKDNDWGIDLITQSLTLDGENFVVDQIGECKLRAQICSSGSSLSKNGYGNLILLNRGDEPISIRSVYDDGSISRADLEKDDRVELRAAGLIDFGLRVPFLYFINSWRAPDNHNSDECASHYEILLDLEREVLTSWPEGTAERIAYDRIRNLGGK